MADDETSAVYPGVECAYEFVVPSYGWMLSRLEAAEGRIQGIQTLAATVTFAIPAAAKALHSGIDFVDGRFILAMVCFAALITTGVVVRVRGRVTLVNPSMLYKDWLHFSEWEFKKNAIFFSGKHFEANKAIIDRKSAAAIGMTALFLVELLFLFGWIVTAND